MQLQAVVVGLVVAAALTAPVTIPSLRPAPGLACDPSANYQPRIKAAPLALRKIGQGVHSYRVISTVIESEVGPRSPIWDFDLRVDESRRWEAGVIRRPWTGDEWDFYSDSTRRGHRYYRRAGEAWLIEEQAFPSLDAPRGRPTRWDCNPASVTILTAVGGLGPRVHILHRSRGEVGDMTEDVYFDESSQIIRKVYRWEVTVEFPGGTHTDTVTRVYEFSHHNAPLKPPADRPMS